MIEMKKDYEKLISDINKICNGGWTVIYDTQEDFPANPPFTGEYCTNVKVYMGTYSECVLEIYDNEYYIYDEDMVYGGKDGDELMELVKKFVHEPEGIKCPLCDGIAEYRQGIDGSVHAWVCTDCSFVGFEFYDDDNYHALGDMLNIAK